MTLYVAAALLLGAAGGVYAGDPGAGRSDVSGRDVYNYYCYFCHGYSGDAKTLAAALLVPPPRDFTALQPGELDRQAIVEAVTAGRPGTAMAPFATVLSAAEIDAVAEFVTTTFIRDKAPNLRYHDPVNGWDSDVKASPAFPFAAGILPVDTPDESLSPAQREGKQLFLQACVSCHDRGRAGAAAAPTWEPKAVSFPRGGFRYTVPPMDTVSGATPYSQHETPPALTQATPQEREGERLFQDNCAFCHAPDGTGRNWIGTFLQPRPRDLTDPAFMAAMSEQRLRRTIRDGLAGTSMPAWRDVLSAAQVDALVAYIRRVFPPLGTDEPVTGSR